MQCLWKPILFLIIYSFTIGICLEGGNDPIDHHPIVHTRLGSVRGNTHEVLNSSVHVFHGIPFAKPPVGQLRFKHPVRADPWNGILDGTRQHNACYQFRTSQSYSLPVPESEDCLYLNVFVPGSLSPLNGSSSNGTRLPVMFFIYGGGYIRGTTSNEAFNGTVLAAVNDVVVVTVEYRLGAFGFLSSWSPEAPGNAGIFDQIMALQWVNENIDSFGGDPGSVTIFGSSAGSISVGLLMLSPLTRNLFNYAILMSGTPNMIEAISTSVTNSFEIIEKIGNFTNCNQNGNTTIIETVICLKNISGELLDRAQESFSGNYKPMLDAYLLPSRVENLYKEVVRKNISVIVGVTKDDGSMFVASALGTKLSKSENLSVDHEVLLQNIIDPILKSFRLNVMQKHAVNYVYSNWVDVSDNEANRQLASDFMSDSWFVCPTNDFGHQLSDRNVNVYYYQFDHRPSNSPWPLWAGSVHGDELNFVFGDPLVSKSDYTNEETLLSYRILKTFGNFAKFGVPSYEGFHWPQYRRYNQTFVSLRFDGDTIKKGPRAKHCALWNVLLSKLKT